MYEKFFITDNKFLMRLFKDSNGKVTTTKMREINESDRRKYGIKAPPPAPTPIPEPIKVEAKPEKPEPKPDPKKKEEK
jgi:hypothetical protein